MIRAEGCWKPWNDYDLLLVTPTREGWDRLRPLCAVLKEEMGLPGVDIVPFTPEDLVRAADTMLVHDAKEGHAVIVGTNAPLCAVPLVPVAPREALTLLLNRMVCLLECPPEELTGQPPDPLRFVSQVSKAVMAAVDASLVEASSYVVSYRDKVAAYATLSPGSVLVEAAREALAFRLDPGPRPWGMREWAKARDGLLEAIDRFVGSVGPEDAAKKLWRRRFGPLVPLLRRIRHGKGPGVRRRAVECAELLILAASRDGADEAGLLRAAAGFLARDRTRAPFIWAEAAREAVARWFATCEG